MRQEELQRLLGGDFEQLKRKVEEHVKKISYGKQFLSANQAGAMYDPLQHEVFDPRKRKMKEVNELAQDESGKSTESTKLVEVNRLAIPFQKQIVDKAVSFLLGSNVKVNAESVTTQEKALAAMIKRTWSANKLDYQSRKIARHQMSETEVAELWYPLAAEEGYWPRPGIKYRLGMRILAPSLGDRLHPVFDPMGDLIAFGRGYSLIEDGKSVEHFELYTDRQILLSYKAQGDSAYTTELRPNVFGKIPVIYYAQDQPEWMDVQPLITRLEQVISDFADTNDYFGSPAMKVTGELKSLAQKGEVGKVYELENGSDVDYLTWNNGPESIKTEVEMLKEWIYAGTQTPDISFASMRGLGQHSGVAIRMLFMDAHLKAMRHQEPFGECLQRRLNLLKKALGVIDAGLSSAIHMEISPEFNLYMPSNEAEMTALLGTACGMPVISQSSAVRLNPLVKNPEEELKALALEAKKAAELNAPPPAAESKANTVP